MAKDVYCDQELGSGNDDGTTPVIFADGHAKSYPAKAIATGASGIIWRFR